MGSYDYLVQGDLVVQIKCFKNEFYIYNPGDKVPTDGSFIIVLPESEEFRFAIIKDGVYVGLTDCFAIFDKWGKRLDSIEDFIDPFVEMIEDLQSSASNVKKEEV